MTNGLRSKMYNLLLPKDQEKITAKSVKKEISSKRFFFFVTSTAAEAADNETSFKSVVQDEKEELYCIPFLL